MAQICANTEETIYNSLIATGFLIQLVAKDVQSTHCCLLRHLLIK